MTLLKKISNINNPNSLSSRLRNRRFQLVEKFINKQYRGVPIEILDIGGTFNFWEDKEILKSGKIKVTCLNLYERESESESIKFVKGDATYMPEVADKKFLFVFSNSVIEHLFTLENQRKMAREIQRISKFFYVQTPNKYFPIEPHYLFPFFQFLPKRLQIFMMQKFNMGHINKKENYEEAKLQIEEIRLLSKRELVNLFNSKIYKEKIFGLTKSYVAHNLPA